MIGAARDLAKAENATAQVRKNATIGGGKFELVELDLARLTNVGACADGLLAKGEPLDVVIANAGVMATLPMGSRLSSASIISDTSCSSTVSRHLSATVGV